MQHVRVERHGRRGAVQGGRRRRDLRGGPDEDDVEDHEPDQADSDETVGRERGDPGREREARTGDQEVARGLRRQVAVGAEPGDEVERDRGGRRPPAEAPAAQHPERGGEERRSGGGQRREEVGAARPRPHESDPERERAGREQQPDDGGGAKVPPPPGREHDGALEQAERGVGGREPEVHRATVARPDGSAGGRGYTPPVPEALRIIPLGGLGEVGRNMMVYEYGDEILVVDAGLAFPRDEHLGVDLLLPDFGYLHERGGRVRAVVLTHGHEDHVGALPYVLRELRVDEVWATRLTLGLVKSKLDEHGLLRAAELREADPDADPVHLGAFELEFVRVAHSIPDAVAVCLTTPAGRVLHTGDYKLDHTPVDGLKTDVGKLAELGNRGIDLLLGDSTNAERPGVTGSERLVGEAFRRIIPGREGRVLVASFASNVHRMQQAIDVGVEDGRQVAVVGRSMRKNVNIARNLGYMEVPEGTLIRPNDLSELPPERALVLCTGSQGEPLSALTRIAYGDHPAVSVDAGDLVIISARPCPGTSCASTTRSTS